MPDILIRGLDPILLKQLKSQAKRHGRTLQSEARFILEQATQADPEAIAAIFARCDKLLAGRRFSGSAKLIRQDRNR